LALRVYVTLGEASFSALRGEKVNATVHTAQIIPQGKSMATLLQSNK